MSHFQPPFTITSKIVHFIYDIAESFGKLSALNATSSIENNSESIKTSSVQGSLSIENTHLTLEQINAIDKGEFVSLPEDTIQETKNVLAVYAQIDHWDANNSSDLLDVHNTLLATLSDNAGHFRINNIDKNKRLQMAPQALHIPQMIDELFDWLKNTEQHPLIVSAVFHYEFEFIQPFSSGNSRLACFWQTLMLEHWNPLFSLLSIEVLIAKTKVKYDQAISESTTTGDSCLFIEYMLENILNAINEITEKLLKVSAETPKSQVPLAEKAEDEFNIENEYTPQVTALINVLKDAGTSLNRKQLQAKLKLKDRKHFRERYLKPAIDASLIEMTIPEKPNSKLQKYRLI